VFYIFKIGLGPSSSHTVGPMVAASSFLDVLRCNDGACHMTVALYGSLAFTGKGHGTDTAILLGLAGQSPDSIDPDRVPALLDEAKRLGCLEQVGLGRVRFDLDSDLIFDYGPPLLGHANGMVFKAFDADGTRAAHNGYFSVGGGFVVEAIRDSDGNHQLPAEITGVGIEEEPGDVPYPFDSARAMLALGNEHGLTIAKMKRANELHLVGTEPGGASDAHASSEQTLDDRLDAVWSAMNGSIDRGLGQRGTLPGGLSVQRRAADIHVQLVEEHGANSLQPHRVMDWLSVFAMAVNEENAAGGRVVTAPTNGAAGVIPAVIRYYRDQCVGSHGSGIRTFLLAASAIGGIIKHNASISGAEVGCQGEVGSASAMAAAGLAAALGGTNEQVENAAEIALEHHLGMTCDPIGGLVQVPCIERNALGAVKAVTAASLALRGEGTHFVPLDECIETMRQTGLDMSDKYKET
ncbi:MAG: L-serine ammonia-lyase, partial [Alphaproteobacteria bacterium]